MSNVSLRVMVVGGGSAGHVIPALPVIEVLRGQGAEIIFVGTQSGLEENLLAGLLTQQDVSYIGIAAGKLRRYFSWQNLTDVFRILLGVLQALWWVKKCKPTVVFSKGGFVSFPVALAAWVWRVPVVAHESDLTPGLANRLVVPFAQTLCLSFAETRVRGKIKTVHTGTPLRAAILEGNAERGAQMLPRRPGMPLLIITGGSLGADALNAVVRSSVHALTERFDVLHVCGAGKLAPMQLPGYEQREYIDEGWGDLLAAADIVVSRAGANALFELLALGKQNLLVPLSAAASRGDQLDNAAFAKQHGFSVVVEEQQFDTQSLLTGLDELRAHGDEYAQRIATFEVPDAAQAIAAEILSCAGARLPGKA